MNLNEDVSEVVCIGFGFWLLVVFFVFFFFALVLVGQCLLISLTWIRMSRWLAGHTVVLFYNWPDHSYDVDGAHDHNYP